MVKSFPDVLVAKKNAPYTTDPWVWLLYVPVGSDHIAITNNNAEVEFNSVTYLPFGFQIGETSQDSEGSLPEVDLTVSNVSRDVHDLLESDSLIGATATLRKVNLAYLDDSSHCDAVVLFVKSATETQAVVTFQLGTGDFFGQPFPRMTFSRQMCLNVYGTEAQRFSGCGVASGTIASYPSCNHTLADCRERDNVLNFGAFPGIPRAFR